MKVIPELYKTLSDLLTLSTWKDKRHKITLLWMVYGLIETTDINLPEWIPFVHSKAKQAQSTERRFSRWFYNDKIGIADIYDPLIKQALCDWGHEKLYLALDTCMLWNTFCQIRLCVIYRGRAIPLVWLTIKHGSSSVKFSVYKDLLSRAKTLLPENSHIVFLADRGFIDTKLMDFVKKQLNWHFRIRYKLSHKAYRRSKRGDKFCQIKLAAQYGHARFYHNVYLTHEHYGPVHLAFARHTGKSDDTWLIVSDEPTDSETFKEYGLRFDIEEGFKDDKSGAFELETSKIRDAEALTRLYIVIAVATLFLVSQGVAAVAKGIRQQIDPHWQRGLSYLKIGLRYLAAMASRGYKLIKKMSLPSFPDPEPVQSSKGKFSAKSRIDKLQVKTVVFY